MDVNVKISLILSVMYVGAIHCFVKDVISLRL